MEMLKNNETLNELKKIEEESVNVRSAKKIYTYTCILCDVTHSTKQEMSKHLYTHESGVLHCSNAQKLSDFTYIENKILTIRNYFFLIRDIMRRLETNHEIHNDLKRLTCPHCKRIVIGKLSYYIHFMLVHYYAFPLDQNIFNSVLADRSPLDHHESRQLNIQFNELLPIKYKDLSNIEYVNDGDLDQLRTFKKGMAYANQDIQYMEGEMCVDVLADYTSDEYQKHLKSSLQRIGTDQNDENKLCNPFYWTIALFKAGLTDEYICPGKLASRLVFTECMYCQKFFTRTTASTAQPSGLPCATCYMISSKTKLNAHKNKKHRSLKPPYVCELCSSVFGTYYKYVSHTIIHLRRDVTCEKCVRTNNV